MALHLNPIERYARSFPGISGGRIINRSLSYQIPTCRMPGNTIYAHETAESGAEPS